MTTVPESHSNQQFEHTDQWLEQIKQRFDRVETSLEAHRQETKGELVKVYDRFDQLEKVLTQQIDRLGGRWGIRNEQLFRQTMRSILEESFGVTVQERHIDGEQYDYLIFNSEHILVEITASVGPKIQERLERKHQLYINSTGITPTRFILAVSSIHSRRAEALRAAGFGVIEPEEEEYEEA